MKWYSKKADESQWNDERIRKKFIWFPTRFGNKTYWLRILEVKETVVRVNHINDFDKHLWYSWRWEIDGAFLDK